MYCVFHWSPPTPLASQNRLKTGRADANPHFASPGGSQQGLENLQRSEARKSARYKTKSPKYPAYGSDVEFGVKIGVFAQNGLFLALKMKNRVHPLESPTWFEPVRHLNFFWLGPWEARKRKIGPPAIASLGLLLKKQFLILKFLKTARPRPAGGLPGLDRARGGQPNARGRPSS